jgi:proprotein convertase subtilisin/kexin type 5
MNPQSVSSTSSISQFTFSLLEDTNWYKVREGMKPDPLIWGKDKGCEFFNEACQSQ